ncbi:MAG: hydroxymethylbilane synthase, partial [Methanothrix sp.]|nr:hydroxymethylbilane synthase [Methanothrix sp.]
DDAPTRTETMIERKILETVGGGCVVPMAVHAVVSSEKARVLAEVLSLDGKRFVRLDENISLQDDDPLSRAEDMGQRLMKMGGRELVDEAVKEFGTR